jgi:5-hydroxyisourate hydrolase-like protein (transthyretin family)
MSRKGGVVIGGVVFVGLLVMIFLYRSWPVRFRSPAVTAIVVDDKTGKPMSDVTVTVIWTAMRRTGNPHNPESTLINSETTRTDTNGVFTVAAWGPVTLESGWFCFSADPTVTFSKSGKELGDPLFNKNHAGFDEIRPLPFFAYTFEAPSWNGKRIPR